MQKNGIIPEEHDLSRLLKFLLAKTWLKKLQCMDNSCTFQVVLRIINERRAHRESLQW